MAVEGARELARAFRKIDREVNKRIISGNRADLRKVGDLVRQEAAALFSPVDDESASGFKTRVRLRGIAVEQSRKRVTGDRPDYGALQMTRALLPALASKEGEAVQAFDNLIDQISRDAGF